MELILDIGSGRSLHNIPRAETMIAKVANMDSHKHRIVFKAQLFQSAPPNIPLDHEAFDRLYHYCAALGYPMTASVFDKDSLAYLLRYSIPFVKIANRPDLYWLIGEVPRKIKVYASVKSFMEWPEWATEALCCVSKYPAALEDYYYVNDREIKYVSDHTVGWELMRRADPFILEKHLCPEREADNPDSGPFACTADELREVIA